MKSGIEKIAVGLTMADSVVETVRTAIMTGEMSPESWYSVSQLANQLGISRSPVREGLLRLEEAGAIEFVRNRGFRVIPITPADVVEIYAIRVALEVPAARRAAAQAKRSAVELERVRSAMSDAAGIGDEGSFRRADEDLHLAILRAGGASRALDVVQRLRATARLLGVSSTRSEVSMQQVLHDHEAIVIAICDGDIETAGRLMQNHLVSTGRIISGKVVAGIGSAEDPEELWANLTEGYHFTGTGTYSN